VKKQKLQYWIMAADALWVPVAMFLAYLLRYESSWSGPRDGSFLSFVPLLLAATALWLAIFSSMKLDGFRRGWHPPAIFSQLFLAVAFLMIILLAAGYLFRIFLSRLTFIYFGVLLLFGFLTIRYLVHSILSSSFLMGATRRVVIVGNGPVAREMALKIERHPEMLCEVVGFLFSPESSSDMVPSGLTNGASMVQSLGIIELLREREVNEIVITISNPGAPEVMNLATRCSQAGIGVSVVPHPYNLYLSKPQLLDIGGMPVLQLREATAKFADSPVKRGVDLTFGLVLSLLSIPAVTLGALMLLRKPGGPFCREPRCGCNGKLFRMWRLNSDRDASVLPRFEVILQQFSITELPQLWNVLRGEMSLVGPRPESPERVKHYSDWQRRRLNVKPGMTGLAQVHGLRQAHSSEEKARFDLQYMMQSSFFFDTSLLLQTLWTLRGRLLHIHSMGATVEEKDRPSRTPAPFSEGRLPSAHSTQSGAD
jgi:lipopolysaccharide/colanic/teichoic acid biosynthesis glycosyltransferase